MVKEIIRDTDILSVKSEQFVHGQDDYIIQDLIDTATAHIDRCVGLAAVQIGIHKRVIVVKNGDKFVPFINPRIVKRSNSSYITTEGCLSLDGQRNVKRHNEITVIFTTRSGKTKRCTYGGFTAQVIQHEIDHTNGILI